MTDLRDRVARVLFERYRHAYGLTTASPTWNEMVVEPGGTSPGGQSHRQALAVWRAWADDVLAVTKEPTPTVDTYCPACRDNGPCDMHCAMCRCDVLDPSVETYSITRWIPNPDEPGTGNNVLMLTVCADCFRTVPWP